MKLIQTKLVVDSNTYLLKSKHIHVIFGGIERSKSGQNGHNSRGGKFGGWIIIGYDLYSTSLFKCGLKLTHYI